MKKLWSIILILALVVGLMPVWASNGNNTITLEAKWRNSSPTISGKEFKDLYEGFWAMPAIRAMIEKGIFEGYSDGTFRPEELVTRAQFSKVLVTALGLPVQKNLPSSFVDMTKQHWALPYVEAARDFLTGFKAGNGIAFKPDIPSVREDMAVALVRALELPLVDETILKTFTDYNSISVNLRPYVATAVEKELIKGYVADDGTRSFKPQGQLTRAETAQLLLNLNVLIDEKIILPANDKIVLDGDWSGLKPATGAVLYASKDSEAVELKWQSDVKQENLKYFKVVASLTDKTPQYPDNGYVAVLSSADDESYKLMAGMGNNGGDFSQFEAGKSYYVAITTVYADDTKKTSNVIRITIPGQVQTTPTNPRVAPVASYKFDNGGIELSWADNVSQSDLQYFKIVASLSDSTPQYPENGYAMYFSDASEDDVNINAGMSYNGGDFNTFTSGKTYYMTVTTVYKDGTKLTSNVLQVTMP